MTLRSVRVPLPPWSYGFVAALAMWGASVAYSGAGSTAAILATALFFAAFSVLVGTGQMLVIASGPGNIDLSIPAVLTLAAYVAMTVMHGRDGLVVAGLLLALVVGGAAGAFNYLAIAVLRLPPIIATLASSFVFESLAFDLGGQTHLRPPDLLSAFAALRVGSVPVAPVGVMALTIATVLALRRTIYGRHLLATGQSERAAILAGVDVGRVRFLAYVLCGAAAGLTGVLLAGFSGGASLNMGDTYLLSSIAVVVLGGTSVSGGQANAVGIWGAALFFDLMTTMLDTFRIQAGGRYLVTGTLIVLIVAVVPRPRTG